MSASRLIVMTPQGKSEMPREYLVDRDRFPTEAITTTDLAKARIWRHPVGARRFRKRNQFAAHYRTLFVDEATIKAAAALDKTAALPAAHKEPAAKPAPARRIHTGRSTKTDPNKRAKRASRKAAVRAIRKAAEKPRQKRRKIRAAA